MPVMEGDGLRHEHQARIFLRPIGSGLPLGFFSFGIGMLLLGCLGIGWIPVDEQKDVGMVLVAFVFPLELVATVFAFLARDTLGATRLGLFTTSWLTFGWLPYSSPPVYEISGGFALALTVLALYGGVALGLEDAHQREVLPLFRRGAAADSFAGFEAQLERLEAEPGVRQQL